jgi:hypothetical protein
MTIADEDLITATFRLLQSVAPSFSGLAGTIAGRVLAHARIFHYLYMFADFVLYCE